MVDVFPYKEYFSGTNTCESLTIVSHHLFFSVLSSPELQVSTHNKSEFAEEVAASLEINEMPKSLEVR